MSMPEVQPAGGLTGYMTMMGAMGQNIDRNARLGALLKDQPYLQAQQAAQTQELQAQTQGQQFTNANAPTMMQAKLYGTPNEQYQQQVQQGQFGQTMGMKQQEMEKQYALLNNTLRHQGLTERRAQELAMHTLYGPKMDAGAGGWVYPPNSPFAPSNQGQPPSQPGQAGGQSAPQPGQGNFVPIPGMIPKSFEAANQLRTAQTEALKPIDQLDMQSNKLQQLLKVGTPIAHQQINEILTNMFDPARVSSSLMAGNKNFGSLTGRVSGITSKFLSGVYSDEQQRQIQQVIDETKSTVTDPTRQRISDHFNGLAEQAGIPKKMFGPTPNFYSSQEQGSGHPLEYNGLRFPSKASLDKYKADGG